MPFALFALAMINVAVGTQGFAFAGVLADIARDLGISIGQAGFFVGASSITFAIGAPLAAALVTHIERRRVILASLVALTAINALCAVAETYPALVLLRVATGVATAFTGALATVAAAALVPPEKRGRAFAVVMGGLTVAFVAGVPLGSLVGGAFGWRATFWLSAAVCALAIALIAVSVPQIAPVAGPRPQISDITGNRGLLHVFSLTLLGFAATFTVVSFIGPVVTRTTGATGAGVGALQIFIGLGSIAGLALGGILSDRGKGRSAQFIAFSVMALSLAAYWPALAAPTGSVPTIAMGVLIFVGATALFLLIPVNLAEIAARAGAAAPIALAFNGSLVSLGQGLGAVLGGQLTDAFGAAAMGAGGAALALIGLVTALLSSRNVGSSDL
jgi:predicted MFS family arabinose efflux permease